MKRAPGQVGAAQVALGETDSADADLALPAVGDRPELAVQQVDVGPGNGPTNGRQRRPAGRVAAEIKCGDDVSLGRAVDVLQGAAGHAAEPAGDGRGDAELLAAGHDLAQVRREQLAPDRLLGQLVEGDQRQEHAGHLLASHLFSQGAQVAALVLGRHDHGPARAQGREDLEERDVEGEGRVLQRDRPGSPPGQVARGRGALPAEQVGQRTVGHGHALGLAGRPGGVKNVGQVIETGTSVPLPGFTRSLIGRGRRHVLAGQQQRSAGVVQHELPASLGITRIDRQVGGPCLEDAEQTDDHLERSIERDADQHAGADPTLRQTCRESSGALVELAISSGGGRHTRRAISSGCSAACAATLS